VPSSGSAPSFRVRSRAACRRMALRAGPARTRLLLTARPRPLPRRKLDLHSSELREPRRSCECVWMGPLMAVHHPGAGQLAENLLTASGHDETAPSARRSGLLMAAPGL